MALTPPHTPELEDEDAERVRVEHERKIVELQKLPAASVRIIKNVTLSDGVATPVSHGLGRPAFALLSPARGAASTGRIEEVRDGSYKLDRFIVLKATGWGATITVDLAVM